MKSNNVDESGVIQIFVPGLPDTPGWVKLSQKKRDALLEHTSRIQQNRQLQMLGEFGELVELHQVQELLEGEEMRLFDYVSKVYPDRHRRTIFRKMTIFNEFAKQVPGPVMKRLASVGSQTLGRFERIASAALGDIRNAVRELPALPAQTDKAAEQYLEKLDEKLVEHRQARRKGKKIKRDESLSAKMATNAVIQYIRESGLDTSAQKRGWLTKVIGWVMEAQAVSGALKNIHRTPIPDGVIIKRGRPIGSKTRRKEAA